MRDAKHNGNREGAMSRLRKHLAVSEIFGPTIQGEGPSAGRKPTYFLRLAGCNMSCSWCDTPFTWDWQRFDRSEEVRKMTIDDVCDALKALDPPRGSMLVVSGGEPMLQAAEWAAACVPLLWERIEVETNGSVYNPKHWVPRQAVFNVSPKLPSAGQGKPNLKPLRLFEEDTRTACFKFVVDDRADLKAMTQLVDDIGVAPRRVWAMPQGVSRGELDARASMVKRACAKHGWNYTDRLHIRRWGNTRGV